MPRRLSSREIEAVLTQHGFAFSRQKGSHRVFTRPGCPSHVTVVAGEREVPVGTFAKIIRQSGLTRQDFGV
ncbi:MAG: type II toxin-antitoxin system HicA family toxin [Opitutae bacterium]|nr:type II toxin-antitoxin system HicA family toxin [Opitutae bacterium]